jgi:MFS family permease
MKSAGELGEELLSDRVSSSSYQRNKIALIGLVLFVNHFSMFVIFPFLPELVAFLVPDKSQGIYAGMLASAFNIGAFISGMIWGPLADRWGRRPVLLAGIVGTVISALWFGFSTNYWMAVAARMLWGVLNGNVPVAKAYLSEICDDSSQAKGFAIIGFAGSFGRMIGPVIGGVLANPSGKYPNSFIGRISIFHEFPYLLPMLVGVSICVLAFPIAYFGLEESLQVSAKVEESPSGFTDAVEVLKNPSVLKSIGLFGMIFCALASFVYKFRWIWT